MPSRSFVNPIFRVELDTIRFDYEYDFAGQRSKSAANCR